MPPQDNFSEPHLSSDQEEQTQAVSQVPVSPPSKKVWFKLPLWIGVVLLVLVVVLYYLPYMLEVFTSDILPTDDRDLIPSVRMVPLEENGWRFMEALDVEVERTGLDRAPLAELLKEPDLVQVQTLLEENRTALELFQQIADARDYQDPMLSDPAKYSFVMAVTPLNAVRRLAQLSILEVQVQLASGNATSAVHALERVLQVTTHVSRPNNMLIAVLVGIMVQDQLYEYLLAQNIDPLWRPQLVQVLQNYPVISREALVSAYEGEYLSVRNELLKLGDGGKTRYRIVELSCSYRYEREVDIQACIHKYSPFADGPFANDYYYHKNETLALFAEQSRAHIGAANSPCGAHVELPTFKFPEPDAFWELYLTRNFIGHLLFRDLGYSSKNTPTERRCALEEKRTQLLEKLL